uniref:Uncharacterized protein n=1 Tax=Phakopsora pachyrhizi TaxID=170000 RepID=A0A0S1MJP9_PHAPC
MRCFRTGVESLLSPSAPQKNCCTASNFQKNQLKRNFALSSNSFATHFDSHQFVSRLEQEGLSRQQAEGLMIAIEQVIDESMKGLTNNLVTRNEMEKQQYTQRVDFAKLKSEIQLVEKQDFALLKSENERLLNELDKLKQRLREEITRTQASVRLDLNLEKGRIRDELGIRELKIREVDTRIEGEIGNLRTTMESVKFNILQYVVGTVASGGALLLAYIRMFR